MCLFCDFLRCEYFSGPRAVLVRQPFFRLRIGRSPGKISKKKLTGDKKAFARLTAATLLHDIKLDPSLNLCALVQRHISRFRKYNNSAHVNSLKNTEPPQPNEEVGRHD